MDGWPSNWTNDLIDFKSMPLDFDKSTASYSQEAGTIDSPNVSKDSSIESTGEQVEKNDNVTKPTFKSVLQAKKRLQAFSASKQIKRSSSKDEKFEDLDRSDKTSSKKSKKALYPLDKAQAVVQEIEEIKQKEAQEAQQEQKKIDAIMAVAYKTIALKETYRVGARSTSIEREQQFKKREIKSRNYRRSDSFKRRSASPENYNSKRLGKLVYPTNWTEYKQQGLTLVKDEELKSKIFPKVKYSTHELVSKFLTFDAPSPLIETFKSLTLDEKLENIPMCYLRITRSKPTLTYSVNNRKNKDSFVTRKQLFQVVSKDRRTAIEKLINSASSRSQYQTRTLTSRPWYTKSWKRSADAECKILENSVGLSFLQTYSDEEEEIETEEVKENEATGESSKHNGRETEFSLSKEAPSDKKPKKSDERETLTPEERPEPPIFEYNKKPGRKEHDKQNESEENSEKKQEENAPEEPKKKDKEDMSETRKAIKDLEEELERRKAIREEEEKHTKKEKKKKKAKKNKKKKKRATSESEDEESYTKKKKKTKGKVKKKKYVSESDDGSSDDKPKKSKKKTKQKTKKAVKKKSAAKKPDKTKKKTEESECEEPARKVGEDLDEEMEEHKNKQVEKSKEKSYEEDFREFELQWKTTSPGEGETTPKNVPKLEDRVVFPEEKFNPPLPNHSEEIHLEIGAKFKTSNKYENEDVKKSFETDMAWENLHRFKYDADFPAKSEPVPRKNNDFLTADLRIYDKKDKHRHNDELEDQWMIERADKFDFNQETSKIKRDGERLEKKRDDRRADKPKSSHIKTEPDWEYLRNKRDKHRHNDYKESLDSLANEFEGFPLEEELSKEGYEDGSASKNEIGTPDTEEYRENWEKDSYPIWESEDEAPKVREKLNSSWESDEEVFERPSRVVEKPRPLSDTFDLEIPLNIKPFKRREIIDPDTELKLLKKESLSLDEERRRLEIEKQRVKELELKVIREIGSKTEEETSLKRRRSKEEEIVTTDHKESKKRDDSHRRKSVEKDEATPKRGRWDRKISSPKSSSSTLDIIDIAQIKKEIINDEDSLTNVSSTTSLNASAVLENEYEEFMKALTTSPKKPHLKNKVLDTEIGLEKNDETKTRDQVEEQIINNSISENDQQIPIPPSPASAAQIVTILPKDIPLIPMPLPKTEIKPVPVPSPQVEIDRIPKPLINLSLSANITLDIAPKFTTPPVCSPNTTANSLQAMMSHSPIVQSLENVIFEKNESLLNFDSSLSDIVKEKTAEEQKPTSKPFVFTSMVLPSKRQLLSNTSLNLDDSDEEEKHSKPLKRLDDIVKENKTEIYKISLSEEKVEIEEKKVEVEPEKPKEVEKEVKKPEKKETPRPKTPQERDSKRKRSPERHTRRDPSPKRSSHSSSSSKRELSPRRRSRESPLRRRGHSPKRYSPRRRSSPKRRSPAKRRHSPKRSISPKSRRRSSISPRRKSPRRSRSPKLRAASPRKIKSKSPERHKPSERSLTDSNKPKSPTANTSPLEGLKRSVADSTISDDLLLQPSMNIEEYTQSPVTQFYDRSIKTVESPKRESLDVRINQVLGLTKEEPQPIPTTYCNYNYAQYSQQFNKIVEPKTNLAPVQMNFGKVKSNFVQVGNMVQILPTEDIPMIHTENMLGVSASPAPRSMAKCEKSQIVQVGNMLQIVPTDLPPAPPLLPEPKVEPVIQTVLPIVSGVPEKQSAESAMRIKVAERREEREKRRLEREKRRKEKERRRKEKEKQRQIKLKQRTENMIKRALELEAEGVEEEPEFGQSEAPAQWPPLPAFVSSTPSKEVGKSILVRASVKNDSLRLERKKVVQFADGVRPGEGTSPSGGEELSSPPPRKKLPKERRYKKTKLHKKNQKKKVKVRIIKKRPETDSDEEDNLPPPSPPPGSPPPHIFPPRMKPQPINNIQSYLPNVVPIQTNHGQQQLFQSPQLSLIMHPRHPHHGPPPPPHHHGPPPPPHHHPHPHGPPLPPGPPHFHHGPPPPPPHHHGPPPPPGPPHHHHGPPPPFHR